MFPLLLLWQYGVAATSEPAVNALQIVVLQPTDALVPAAMAAESAMREAIVGAVDASVTFRRETLGSVASLTVDDPAQQADALRALYAGEHVDLVMAATAVAVRFMEQYGASIWPDVPVVYFGVGAGTVDPSRLPANYTGVGMPFDVQGTVDLAFRLQPHPGRIIYITGTAPYDRWWTPVFKHALQRYRDRAPIEEWLGRPVSAMRADLNAVPADAIVLYASMFRDEAGTGYTPAEVARALAQSSRAPVFGILESYVGTGVLGGAVVDFRQHGTEAGLLAAQVLNSRGTSIALPRYSETATRCTIDARQLQRWGVDRARAPQDCELRFQTPSPWHLYRTAIVVALLLIALAVVMYQQERKRRRLAQEAYASRSEMAGAARLALVGQITASVTHEVTQPLSAILSNAEAASLLLATANPRLDEVRQILDDIRADNQRTREIVQRVRSLLRDRELHKENLDMNEVVRSVVTLVRTDVARRGLVIRLATEADMPGIQGDPVHLQQALLNLLMNAADAMESVPPGERYIDVDCRCRDGTVTVSVTDVGTGVPADQLSRLFDAFFTTKQNGMGLGLSTARAIVDAHGGRIWAKNNATSRGTTVAFAIPVA
ncbi:sensor histidine kinase [Povalibacter sp.]|uniref:sensor histidine kinase n=1 Tax=Povalibacter sp. TaxID=1962978 RepID=UPI002D1FA41B|nr:sensor histidine kinase [Povalibacter sp.]